jgi:dCTP deaminase
MSSEIPVESLAGMVSDRDILKSLEEGTIVIEPFNKAQLNPASYDVCLGQYFYRQQTPVVSFDEDGCIDSEVMPICPWAATSVRTLWGDVQEARSLTEKECEHYSLDVGSLGYCIAPGETILTHTSEYIGARVTINSYLRAKSTTARVVMSMNGGAGFGDPGYISRWSLIISNNSLYPMLMVVGKPIAQIVFVTLTSASLKDYTATGRYQTSTDIKEIMASWTPAALLPKVKAK